MENTLWVITSPTHVPIYDFAFRQFFDCRTPFEPVSPLPGVARVGAIEDYQLFYEQALEDGIRLLNTPAEHERCSNLPAWYPLIEVHTPRSRWYETIPSLDQILAEFTLPVFVKGSRQTSRHQAAASIVRSQADFERAVQIFCKDPILHWQGFVCREFVPLRPIPCVEGPKIKSSFEFRTFWHRSHYIGSGRYWYESPEYGWTEPEKDDAISLARTVADKMDCGFLVIDLAMTQEGRWIVIECNDGFESGYAGVSPFVLWRNLLSSVNAD